MKSTSPNLSNCKFCRKTKMAIFGTKNTLFCYFWGRSLKNFFHIWNQHPHISYILKILERKKSLKQSLFSGHFGAKMPYLGIFLQELKKTYCDMQNQHPKICLIPKFWKKKKKKVENLGANMSYLFIFWEKV